MCCVDFPDHFSHTHSTHTHSPMSTEMNCIPRRCMRVTNTSGDTVIPRKLHIFILFCVDCCLQHTNAPQPNDNWWEGTGQKRNKLNRFIWFWSLSRVLRAQTNIYLFMCESIIIFWKLFFLRFCVERVSYARQHERKNSWGTPNRMADGCVRQCFNMGRSRCLDDTIWPQEPSNWIPLGQKKEMWELKRRR